MDNNQNHSKVFYQIITYKFLFFVLLFSIAFTGNTGKITGKILSSTTNEALFGANVFLEGTSIGSATDLDGNYFILNVPPGIYTLNVKMIGYKKVITEKVRVSTDLTTTVNINMETSVLEGEMITVTSEKPIVQMDMTSSQHTVSKEEMLILPVDDIEGAVALSAGAVEKGGVLHLRGGRAQETVYLFDGISLNDPLTGNANDTNVPMLGVGEMNVITGGFSAEYGDAQSGVINVSGSDGKNIFETSLRLTTSGYFSEMLNTDNPEKLKKMEFSTSGPLFAKNSYFSLSGEINEDYGRFSNQFTNLKNFAGKLSYSPLNNLKFTVSGLFSVSDFQDGYGHLWSKTVNEDELWDYSPDNPATDSVFYSWFGNNTLNTEDINFNGILDGGEDLNGDGLLQSEDIDRDSSITVFSLFDRQPWWRTNSYLYSLSTTYTFSSRTYLTLKFASYTTEATMNIIERLNEDVNYNGVLDDGEDLNGNGILDEYNPQTDIWGINDSQDMFHDENNNDFVDESENTHDNNGDGVIDENDWLSWNDIPSEGQKSGDYYTVAPGHPNTFSRDHWHYDFKTTKTLKLDFVSQVDIHNKIKTGLEIKFYDLSNHDAPDRYGYAENYTVYPIDCGLFFSDKMEYKGIIVNAGLRAEYFDATEQKPTDETDPVWDSGDFEDWDGDGINEYYYEEKDLAGDYVHSIGDIKNPISTNSKIVFSPRLGVSHPITDKSMLYFNYGRYYQRPRLDFLFRNINYNLGGGFPIIGNPDLNPELTVSYEIGLRNEISRNVLLELKGFYKDIFGLTDTRPVYWTISDWYTTYENRDYGNIRGTEFILALRPPALFFGQINYTYSIAKGKSSSFRQGYETNWAGGIVPTFESYLDWDQTHTINLELNCAYKNFLTTMIINYGSGTRYTKPGQGNLIIENTERMPWTLTSSMKINYRFRFGSVKGSIFATVNNVFNKKNIWYLDDVEWYHTYKSINDAYENGTMSEEDYISQTDNDNDGVIDENKKYPEMGPNLNPAVYSDNRRFRIGVTFEF